MIAKKIVLPFTLDENGRKVFLSSKILPKRRYSYIKIKHILTTDQKEILTGGFEKLEEIALLRSLLNIDFSNDDKLLKHVLTEGERREYSLIPNLWKNHCENLHKI